MNRNLIRRIAATLAMGCLLLMAPVAAQNPGEGGQRGRKMMQRMASELDLTQEQTAQLRTIFQSRKTDMKALRSQMTSIFTAEQRAGLKALRGGGQRPDRGAMRAKMQELGITRDQMRQMRALRQQLKQNRESIQSEISAILTPEQRQKYDQMREGRERKRGRAGRQGGRRRP